MRSKEGKLYVEYNGLCIRSVAPCKMTIKLVPNLLFYFLLQYQIFIFPPTLTPLSTLENLMPTFGVN